MKRYSATYFSVWLVTLVFLVIVEQIMNRLIWGAHTPWFVQYGLESVMNAIVAMAVAARWGR